MLVDTESRDLQNVQGTTAGAIVKRRGLVTLATPETVLSSLFAFEAVTIPYLIAAGGTKIYSIDGAGTVVPIKTGLAPAERWEFVQSQITDGQGPLFGMNGIDTPQQWSGTGAMNDWTATTGAVPNGQFMVLAGNRIWVSGVKANPSRVYFSDLIPGNNGPVTWPSQNVAIFDENDGADITGLGHVGPYILVAKARKLYMVTDLNTGDARRLSDNIGCISHRSIAQAPEGTYFLGEDRGVYLTNGSKITSMSDVIQPTIDSIQAGTKADAVGAYFNGHYYLSVNLGSGHNDTILDYDSALQSWWLHTFGSNQFAVWHPTSDPQLYSAKATSAIVDQCFVPGINVDNGTPFLWRWRGPWQSPTFYRRRRFPTPYFRKRFRQVRYDGTGTVDFSLATDFSPGEVLLKSNAFVLIPNNSTFGGTGTYGNADGTVFGDAAPVARARQYTLGVYNAISVVFSSTSITQDRVFSYTLIVTDRKDLITA